MFKKYERLIMEILNFMADEYEITASENSEKFSSSDSDSETSHLTKSEKEMFVEISIVPGTCVRVRSGDPIPKGCLDMKPGKSTTFASCMYNCKRKFFLCMSANPATVPIVAHVVLLPFLNMIHHNCSTPIVMQICENISIQNLFKRIYKRQKQTIMMSVKNALHTMHKILDDEYEYYTETVETNNAYGRVLANNIKSSTNVPFYNTSTKHGYAVLVSDGKSKRRVLKAHLTFAEISVVPGTCVRVRSGDPIPNGATAVVTLANTKVLEECSDNDDDYFNINDKEYEIEVLVAPQKNENIRNADCEIENGQTVLQIYSRIGSVELGILKLCGINSVPVIQIPSVGLLSIGDKLEQPGYTSTLKHIYDCNSITLISLLKENGYDPVDLGISAYQLKAIIKNIKYALDKVNLLVIMGHANDNDLLKPILREYFNAVIHFGATAVVTLENTKILEERSHNVDDYFNIDNKEYQIEVLVTPKKNENIRLDDIVNKIKNALDKVDILVIMGRTNDKDLLKPILKAYFNAMIHFGRVDMKPGKSTMFATCTFKQKIKFFLCMSANPTTVSVVTHVLLLPFLNEMYCNYLTKPINMQACVRLVFLHPVYRKRRINTYCYNFIGTYKARAAFTSEIFLDDITLDGDRKISKSLLLAKSTSKYNKLSKR
ncbi:GEPH protein, partial [Acromyrmex charruanus]